MRKALLFTAGLFLAGNAFAEWGTSPSDPVALFPNGTTSYAAETKPGANGDVWCMIYHPNLKDAESEMDISNVVYEYRLQHFDSNGNPTFPAEGLLLSDYSNLSYTVINDYLLVDSDGNAVVAVRDCRNSNDKKLSYTGYKVSPEGEMLWSEDGVAISDPEKPADVSASMDLVQLEDKSYVFAWMEMTEAGGKHVCMQRLSNDGKAQWGASKVYLPAEATEYPNLVNSGNNTFIMVYARTESDILYAVKLDFECESVWGKDVRIYRGGWGSVPPHLQFDVVSSGDGGVLVSWDDDRAGTNLESAYLSYVDTDGKLCFSGASDEADCKLGYNQYRNLNVKAVPAADGSCFYALWRTVGSANQSYQGIMIQKVSKEGELLWGDDAKEIIPFDIGTYSYLSIQAAGENGACAFYEVYNSYSDQQGFAYRFDGEGKPVWNGGAVAVSKPGWPSSALDSQPYPGKEAYLLTWTDGADSVSGEERSTYVMALLNQDGTFGATSSVASVTAGDGRLAFDGTDLLCSLPDCAAVDVYDCAGTHVAALAVSAGKARADLPAGLYIARSSDGISLKFTIK